MDLKELQNLLLRIAEATERIADALDDYLLDGEEAEDEDDSQEEQSDSTQETTTF